MASSPSYRVLVVCYHFPPSTVAGTFRPLRLAKYLDRLGHKVWVLTATPGSYVGLRVDHELEKEIPAGVRVKRVPNINLVRLYEKHNPPAPAGELRSSTPPLWSRALRGMVPGHLRTFLAELSKFPDQDASWSMLSLLPALSIIARNRIDLVCSSGPPFGAHVLGLMLKKITRKPWIAQYGNPWTGNPSISWDFSLYQRLTDRLDLGIIRSADAIMTIDDILADCIHALGRRDHVYMQPNGYDPEQFAPTPMPEGKFTVTYAGSLYNVHDPQIIYDALGIIERQHPEAREDMRVVFAGPPASHVMAKGAPPDLTFTGPLPHAELIRQLNDSHVLLDFLTASADEKFSTSCKIYEYMAARRPILAVTPDGPLASDVRSLNLGTVVPAEGPGPVASAIMDFYRQYRAGTLAPPDSPGILDYAEPKLTHEFLQIAEQSCFSRTEDHKRRRHAAGARGASE